MKTNETYAVCLTCHRDYLGFLKTQVTAIDRQSRKFNEKFLCLDSCDVPSYIDTSWTVIRMETKSPNPLRNEAIRRSKSKWIVFADSDDKMNSKYLSKVSSTPISNSTGIIYSDVKYSNGREYTTPEIFNYWQLRKTNYISAGSAWRVEAVKNVGGFGNTERYDDYALALKITSTGWRAVKSDAVINCCQHALGHRHLTRKNNNDFSFSWEYRSFGIVTLFAGRKKVFSEWAEAFKNIELPPNVHFYAVDNSGKAEFGKKIKSLIDSRNIDLTYIKEGSPLHNINASDTEKRHKHVCGLYNSILSRVNDDWVVLWEDDVIPPVNALKTLVERYKFHHIPQTAGIGALYKSRCRKSDPVGGRLGGGFLRSSDIKRGQVKQVGFISGGFSLFNNGHLREALPFRFFYESDGSMVGWDEHLGKRLRENGYDLFIHGGVKCQHLTEKIKKKSFKHKNKASKNGRSIIIPAYKSDWCLQRCLDSVFAQPYSFSHIMIGIDACRKTLNAVPFFDIPKQFINVVEFYYFPEHGGPYPIRNTLAEKVNGNIIIFFDADDTMDANHIYEQTANLETGTISYPAGRWVRDGKIVKEKHYAHGAFSIHKKDFLNLKGFENRLCGMDTEFSERALRHGFRKIKSEKVTYTRYKHGGNLTENPLTNKKSKIRQEVEALIAERRITKEDPEKIYTVHCERVR